MTLTFHVLWMVCALGALAFAAAVQTRRQVAAFAAGFGLAALFISPERLPGAEWLGVMSLLAAVVSLAWPRLGWSGAVAGGVLAGAWGTLIQLQGLPRWWALATGAAVAAFTVRQTVRRPQFAPERLREEALLLVAVLGGLVAVMPGILDGWQSAKALNGQAGPLGSEAIPVWALGVITLALVSGMAHSMWSRR